MGGIAALVLGALLIRTLVRAFSHSGTKIGVAGGAAAAGFGGGKGYRPLHEPAPHAATETHAMSSLP